jgi:hypothetical protein
VKELDGGGREAVRRDDGGRTPSRTRRGITLPLSETFTAIVMAILFFTVLTPIGLIMRLTGRDPLRLRLDREALSYWLTRGRAQDTRQTSMTRQF